MPSQSIANKRMHLDKKVWFTMLIMCVICVGLLGYSYVSKQKCVTYNIITRGTLANGKCLTGEPIFFSITLTNGEDVVWNFGDRTGNETKSAFSVAKHTYTKEGIYNVTAKTKMVCSDVEIKVVVTKASAPQAKQIQIAGPVTVQTKQRVSYYTTEVDCKDFEWKILDKNFPVINKQFANYSFQTPGLYRLHLTLDHNPGKSADIDINVTEGAVKALPMPSSIQIQRPPVIKNKKEETSNNPLPPVKKEVELPKKTDEPVVPANRKNTQIGIRGFQTMLENIISGHGNLEDFDEYLYFKGNTNTSLTYRKATKDIQFSFLINQIKGQPDYTIDRLELIKDKNDATKILGIEIKLNGKRSFFDKILGKNKN